MGDFYNKLYKGTEEVRMIYTMLYEEKVVRELYVTIHLGWEAPPWLDTR